MLTLLMLLIISPIEINWDGYEYYRPVIDNFLFRPLGWKKPDSSPKYELIATIIGKDKKYIKAYIKDVKYGRDYFVGVGDNVGDRIVQKIDRGMVQLDDDTKFTQPSFGLLNTGTTRRQRTSGSTKSADSTSASEETTKQQNTTGVRQRTSRGRVDGSGSGGVDWQAQVQNFQNSSPEERQRMIEQFRSMRGNRQGGRGRRGRDR
tara:strand:- start:1673 stop:2287 length:615 start_codon:yes stop_codon:yes gene_type:complete